MNQGFSEVEAKLSREIAALFDLGVSALKDRWRSIYGTEADWLRERSHFELSVHFHSPFPQNWVNSALREDWLFGANRAMCVTPGEGAGAHEELDFAQGWQGIGERVGEAAIAQTSATR